MQLGHAALQCMKITIVPTVMNDMLKRLDGCGSVEFEFYATGEKHWKWFPVVLSYCSDISEGKCCLCVQNGLAVSGVQTLCPMHCYDERRAKLETLEEPTYERHN